RPRCPTLVAPFFRISPPPPRATLFPYTTLFRSHHGCVRGIGKWGFQALFVRDGKHDAAAESDGCVSAGLVPDRRFRGCRAVLAQDRKSTRLNSSHVKISYAVFCLKKKNKRWTGL